MLNFKKFGKALKRSLVFGVVVLSVLCAESLVWGEESKPSSDFLDQLEYPELQVTPRASERLMREWRSEKENHWSNYFPTQLSSSALLVAGLRARGDVDSDKSQSDKDDNETVSLLGVIAGGAWLGYTTYQMVSHRPYRKSYRKISRMKKATRRQELVRERMAEEEIDTLARRGRRMRYLSAGTNFVTSVLIASSGRDVATLYGGVSALLALGPLFFKTRWEFVSQQHSHYKKRIYGPVGTVLPVRKGNSLDWIPGFAMKATF